MGTTVELDLFSELLEFADKKKDNYDETKRLIKSAYELYDLFGKIYTDLESLGYYDYDEYMEDTIELRDSIKAAYEDFDNFTDAVYFQTTVLKDYLEYIDDLFQEIPVESNGKAVWIKNPLVEKLKPMELWQAAMILSQLSQIYNRWDEMKIEAILAAVFSDGLDTQLEVVDKIRDSETLKRVLIKKILARKETYMYDTTFGYRILDAVLSEMDEVSTNLRDWMEDANIDRADLNSLVDAQGFVESALNNVLLPFAILGLEFDY